MASEATFGSCSKTCGCGYLTQRRNIRTYSRCRGRPCPYSSSPQRYRTVSCNTQCCPVNCLWTWNSWSPCQGCGVSQQTRSISITRNPSCGGTACPSRRSETRSCNTGVSVSLLSCYVPCLLRLGRKLCHVSDGLAFSPAPFKFSHTIFCFLVITAFFRFSLNSKAYKTLLPVC